MNAYIKFAKITMVLVYLVVIAGAVVRMTGSGMGCPDWPKCFGYMIPPTQEESLLWEQEKVFNKGELIIYNERLYQAISDFQTTNSFNESNWQLYTKHDYAKFNVYHTWTEFINRLLGALAGLATVILAFWSFKYWSSNKRLALLAIGVVLGMGFEAWLGATVVYSVLLPVKITVHMLMALLIIAMMITIVYQSTPKTNINKSDAVLKKMVGIALVMTVIQIILGTQVREFVDEQIKSLGESNSSLWLSEPPVLFYIHRSFSILILLTNAYLLYRAQKLQLGYGITKWIVGFVVLLALNGIIIYYLDFPLLSQPIHLILASVLFGMQYYLILENYTASKTQKRL
jgi:cytochrome c oxidase assembly protein subunit 15